MIVDRASALLALGLLALSGCPALLSDDFRLSSDAGSAPHDAAPPENDSGQPSGDGGTVGEVDAARDGPVSAMTHQDATGPQDALASQDAAALPDVVVAPPADAASCVATQTAAAPAYCPAMGPYSAPAHYIRVLHASGALVCDWEPTPSSCLCDYSCGCMLSVFVATPTCTYQCAMNANGLLSVYCMGDGPP